MAGPKSPSGSVFNAELREIIMDRAEKRRILRQQEERIDKAFQQRDMIVPERLMHSSPEYPDHDALALVAFAEMMGKQLNNAAQEQGEAYGEWIRVIRLTDMNSKEGRVATYRLNQANDRLARAGDGADQALKRLDERLKESGGALKEGERHS